jgi:hypothetical protein
VSGSAWHPDTATAGRPGRGAACRTRPEHSISGGVAGRAAAVLGYYRQMPEAVELRLHDTPLYNSVYRFDDELLVNVHAYGILAAHTPVMHRSRVPATGRGPTSPDQAQRRRNGASATPLTGECRWHGDRS